MRKEGQWCLLLLKLVEQTEKEERKFALHMVNDFFQLLSHGNISNQSTQNLTESPSTPTRPNKLTELLFVISYINSVRKQINKTVNWHTTHQIQIQFFLHLRTLEIPWIYIPLPTSECKFEVWVFRPQKDFTATSILFHQETPSVSFEAVLACT